ncbi:rhs element Vgr family protein [Escherichia coli]|nr:rhs element Vgr family protein [Escherichia coli]
MVTWFELGENDKNQMLYSMKVHPPLWRAGLRQNFRIFQNEDIKSILGTMLQENGVTEWSPLFSEPHPSREFCVQYGETDYDFLCRMAAEEGIFFYEEHAYKSTDQSLVLCDTVRHLPESFEIPWNPNTRTEVSTLCISQFRYSAQIRPSSVVTKDYTFKRPGWAGRFEQEGQHQDYQRTQYEVYDYPGRFKSAHGQNFARWQMDGWRNNAETARGMGRSPEIWPGRRIVLTGHPQANLNREWQVVASELHGEQPQAVPGRQGAGTALENHFAVIPADRTWRPQPLLKPLVDGPQSAVVTGPAGEEIFCDEHGRVRVKFNWDRYNPADQDSSCWIRVAQAWAGTGFGHLAIPRVGQEVIVDFLNGDPDQPIIMGRTYHQENRTPGRLPGTKTQMTIRSKTYMGSGFNELKFDDATGREQVYIHAQKNMDNPYHAQYILRRRDDYLELFDRDALSSRFFYDAFPGMRLRHPVTDDTSDDRLAHSPADRMYMLGGMSDTASNRITFERDSQYRITGVSHTDGIRLKLTYHASGYLKAIHRTDNGIQTLATYEQDARGRLTEADARLDYHLFYEYDAADRIIRWSDNDQTWSRFTYDAQGRCVTVTGAEGYYNATLDYGDGCTTVTDGKGTHRYYYDPDGNILREAAPDGSTTTYEWDEFHHLLARHSPAGRVEKFEYNAAHGQLSRYTAADGAEWQYRYDERGLLSNITDPAGQTWTQQCDERGLPVSLVSPQGEETRLAYTAQGLLSGIFRQDERRLGIEYDHHNRPETLTDVMGREHHTEYSGHDLPVKMRGPGGQSVRLQWQQHHKLSGLERAETGAEGFRYDRHGNLLAYTDGNGVVWTMEYGPFDLPVARTDGEGHRWQYRYDKDTLQLTEVINPQGESYLYVLDNCGRVTEEHDWGGVVWRYRYDADGLCTARVNGLEETILYSRDAAGRLAEIITPEGKTQYAYDKSGRLTGIFSPDGTSQRTGYDERGRVNVTTQGRRAIEYHYPDEHTVIRCILPPEDERDRHPGESLLKTTYRYNAAGELTEVILPGDETLTFSRDEAGREVLRHSNRGFACEQGWNAAGQPVSQRAGFFPEEATWDGLVPSLVREYRYDSAGNVSGVTSREDYGRETRREYRLDRNGQVTAVTASGTGLGYGEGDESYGYDSCGYLKAQSAGRHRISEETDQYAGGHRLKQAGNTQYDYDAAGRMVSRTRHRDGYRPETERFRWDSRDQLTGYCSAQGEQWEYRHDASGRRTEKRCDRKKIRFTYLWDGDSIAEIREYRDDKLYSVRHLVFNGFELISQQFSRVRQAHPSVAPQWMTRTNHAVSDLTGRPLMLFNSEGKTVWRPGQTSLWGLALSLPADTGYPDPRGELDPEAAPGLLYAGQWQDVESGLCYNRFRYYEPETGMYLVSDPLGLQGGEQTYRYVPNPLRWIDPLGLNKGASLSKMMNSSSDLMGLRRQPQNFWRLYRGKDI